MVVKKIKVTPAPISTYLLDLALLKNYCIRDADRMTWFGPYQGSGPPQNSSYTVMTANIRRHCRVRHCTYAQTLSSRMSNAFGTFCRKSGHIRFGTRGELGHFRPFGTPILPLFLPNNRCPYGISLLIFQTIMFISFFKSVRKDIGKGPIISHASTAGGHQLIVIHFRCR